MRRLGIVLFALAAPAIGACSFLTAWDDVTLESETDAAFFDATKDVATDIGSPITDAGLDSSFDADPFDGYNGECNGLEPDAAPTPMASCYAGSPPAATGGVIPAGTYYLAKIEFPLSGTCPFTGNGLDELDVVKPLPDGTFAVSLLEHNIRFAVTWSVSGTTLTLHPSCPITDASPTDYQYSVTAGPLITMVSPGGWISTYQRVGP